MHADELIHLLHRPSGRPAPEARHDGRESLLWQVGILAMSRDRL